MTYSTDLTPSGNNSMLETTKMENTQQPDTSTKRGPLRFLSNGILGFNKGYNAILFFIFGGALLGFSLAQLRYIDLPNVFCKPGAEGNGAAPGECYYYQSGFKRIGIIIHLATILPAGVLVVLQFVPKIRHKALLFHRLNGYVVLVLTLGGIVSALMITRTAFGGTLDIQVAMGVMAIATLFSLGFSYVNIKRLHIDQHRAWMLRGWFYASSIITLRLIMIISAQIVSRMGPYYAIWPCAKMDWLYTGSNSTSLLLERYPLCASYVDGSNPGQVTPVQANFGSNALLTEGGRGENQGAALNINFGMAAWLALVMHAVGVEVYMRLTPKESERLRKVSAERRAEAGYGKA